MHQVQTLEALSKVMLNAKNTSPVLCYRIAGVADLVAAEAKYHLKCYVTFFRKAEKQNAGHEMDFEDSFQQACFHKCYGGVTLALFPSIQTISVNFSPPRLKLSSIFVRRYG